MGAGQPRIARTQLVLLSRAQPERLSPEAGTQAQVPGTLLYWAAPEGALQPCQPCFHMWKTPRSEYLRGV